MNASKPYMNTLIEGQINYLHDEYGLDDKTAYNFFARALASVVVQEVLDEQYDYYFRTSKEPI